MMNLVEATVLALQGKLSLNENRARKTKKSEAIDINVNDNTSVSIADNETIVETDDATVIVDKKDNMNFDTSLPMDITNEETFDMPLEGDETVIPEEVADEETEDEEVLGESKKVTEAYNYNWKDDIEEVDSSEENDDIFYAVAENIQQTDEYYKDWDVFQIMSDIICLWKIQKRSRLYDYLLKWYGSEEELLANVRDVYDTNNAIYFVTGAGYSIFSADLLGGTADGIAEREFDNFVNNGGKKAEAKEIIENKDVKTEDTEELTKLIANIKNLKQKNNIAYNKAIDKCLDIIKGVDYIGQDNLVHELEKDAYLGSDSEEVTEEFANDWDKACDKVIELVKNSKNLTENKDVKTEDTEEFLEPRFDTRKSFYKKAKVVTKDNGDEELYSYGTHVGGVRGGKPYSKGKYSQTTTRHQKDYFKQRGFEPKEVPVEENKAKREEAIKRINARRKLEQKDIEAIKKKIEAKQQARKKIQSKLEARARQNRLAKVNERHEKVKETVVENKLKGYSSKTFNEALTKHFKKTYTNVDNVTVTSVNIKGNSMKIEAKIKKLNNYEKDICLEMKQVSVKDNFVKYTLNETKSKKTESRKPQKTTTMLTYTNKDKVLECRYIIKK